MHRLRIRIRILALALAIAGSVAAPVHAGYRIGADLLKACTPENPSGECLGYLAAQADLHDTLISLRMLPRLWCIPPKTELQSLARVVHEYVQAHPDAHKNTAADLVARAYSRAHPCA